MDYASARLNMVESQVRPSGITDRRISAAMLEVPREEFVPERWRAIAYMDGDVPLSPARHDAGPRSLMGAMPFARLLQQAAIRPADRVLVVGAGTGYGAAVISRIAAEVVALESDPGLLGEARELLADCGNVRIVAGALQAGAASLQPYDAIVIEGRAGEVPATLFSQLAEEGRLVAVVGEAATAQGKVYTRTSHSVAVRNAFDASAALLPGFGRREAAFVF